MAWIYLITNDINQKQYIGKTEYENIQKRWKEHLRDYKKQCCEKRPLYDAMKKYGIEHFHIQEIEYVPPEKNLEEREQYWVNYYDTYRNGYNATKGGDGKHYLDYNLIIETYQQCQNCAKTAEIIGCHEDSVRQVLKKYNIIIKTSAEVNKISNGKSVEMYDLNNNYIQTFPSANEAIRFIKPEYKNKKPPGGMANHIISVCKGKRKTAYGYIWHFAN